MWWTILPYVLVTVAVVVLPGFVVNFAAGLRPVQAVGYAPLASVGLISVAAIAADLVGVSWSALPVLVATAVVAVLAGLTRLLIARLAPARAPARALDAASESAVWWRSSLGWTLGSLVIAATVLAIDGVRMLGTPTAFSQTYDNIYHLNAVRWIVDHGNGSSLTMNMLTGDGPSAFYPSAWHDLASLTLISMGSPEVTLGNNALILVVLALVWPVSCLLLVRAIFPPTPAVILGTGVLVASISAFPYLLLGFGVLFPNFLGLALLPAVMALAVSLLGLGHGESYDLFPTLVVGLVGMGGVALAHPNVALTMVSVVAPVMAFFWAARGIRDLRAGSLGALAAAARVAALVALLGLAYVLFRALHAPYDSLWWPVSRSVSHAVGEAVLLAPRDTPVPYLAAALTLAGCYAVLRHNRHWWLLGCHCAFVFLWVVVSAATVPDFRNFFGAPWYNDNFRLASLLPITAIPLAALGFEFVLGKVDDAVGARLSNGRPGWLSGALVGVGVLVLLVGTQVGNKQEMIAWVNDHYTVTPDSVLVDSDEYAVLQQVPEIVPPDGVIAVNPWNGSSMAYALTGRQTIFTHVQYPDDPDKQVLIDSLDEASTDAEVCQALSDLGVGWVLDFGNDRLINNEDRAFPGFEDLEESPGFVLRAESGTAALYEITACGLG